jgi:diaminohydroxyphosphoribosylaminopyrimidine deaminase / 5-amino-6-(5-phosphoribosylamino)uracil reductase
MNYVYYMQRALELAKNGLGAVSPNPMVGCVIVYNNVIIGEGWHQKFGAAHAEVNAVDSVGDKNLLKESTVFVNLEPCSYYGKTPACSDLLIRYRVKKVVVAALDPNPKVAGNGAKALELAGIKVEVGVCEKEAIKLNRRFFINQKLNRPYVILKWAQTKDGFIARSNYDSKWISNEFSRQKVHRWRAEEDAILVGKNTALYDNPSLTVRDWDGKNPLRVVLDRNLELKSNLNLFNGKVQTLVYNTKLSKTGNAVEFIKLKLDNFILQVLSNLAQRDLGSIIIEGGKQVLNNFIQQGLWEEARVFTSNEKFGEGIKAPKLNEQVTSKEKIENDMLAYYFNPKTAQYWQKN